MTKKSIFKKIFSSNKDCCSVEFEEVEENNEKEQNKDKTTKNESLSCSSKAE
ncbi:hypothetical protein [Ornithinibacillus gellani]|uniref:hypothetical protein n=1 Tax=Ornithinibacillus gellani TaxID=2293253 RepID=UPI0016818700|nr:hypothetical protein [Ornithinibacillus gellani]